MYIAGIVVLLLQVTPVPLSSSPPCCSPLILLYIIPVSTGELDLEVSSVPASDAIRGFTPLISKQWDKICLWFQEEV